MVRFLGSLYVGMPKEEGMKKYKVTLWGDPTHEDTTKTVEASTWEDGMQFVKFYNDMTIVAAFMSTSVKAIELMKE